jgi:hypothetical protein
VNWIQLDRIRERALVNAMIKLRVLSPQNSLVSRVLGGWTDAQIPSSLLLRIFIYLSFQWYEFYLLCRFFFVKQLLQIARVITFQLVSYIKGISGFTNVSSLLLSTVHGLVSHKASHTLRPLRGRGVTLTTHPRLVPRL